MQEVSRGVSSEVSREERLTSRKKSDSSSEATVVTWTYITLYYITLHCIILYYIIATVVTRTGPPVPCSGELPNCSLSSERL